MYRLVGGTATDILVYFPASFSSWMNDILWLSISSRRITPSFRSLSSGTQNLRCAVSEPTPRKTRSVVGSSEHFGKNHEVTAAVKDRECEGFRLTGCLLWPVGLRSRVARGFNIRSHRVTPRYICLGIVSTGLPRRQGCGICTGRHTIRNTVPSKRITLLSSTARSTPRTRKPAGHCETPTNGPM